MPGIIIPGFGCLDFVGEYQPGDPAPTDYNDWHAWAEVQDAAGLRQVRCACCSKLKYPQEFSDHVLVSTAFHVHTGKKVFVETSDPICLTCFPKVNSEINAKFIRPKPRGNPDEQAQPVPNGNPTKRRRRK